MKHDAARDAAMYSPNQICTAAFFGGPFALVYLLSRNFRSLGRLSEAKKYMVFGVTASLVALVLLVILPGRLSFGLFLGCAIAGRQLSRSEHFGGVKTVPQTTPIHSNWRVFGAGAVAFFVWLLLVFLIVIALGAAGVNLPD